MSDTGFPDPGTTVCITSFSPSQLVQLFHCTPSPSVTVEGNLVAILSEPPSLARPVMAGDGGGEGIAGYPLGEPE